MRPSLGPVVKPEHPLNNGSQPPGHIDRPRATAHDSSGRSIERQIHTEGGAHGRRGASELHDSPPREDADDVQAVVSGKPPYHPNVGLGGPEPASVLLAAQMLAL